MAARDLLADHATLLVVAHRAIGSELVLDGTRFRANCPMIDCGDRQSSFWVDLLAGRYGCSACECEGGPIDFLRASGLDRDEAVRFLAAFRSEREPPKFRWAMHAHDEAADRDEDRSVVPGLIAPPGELTLIASGPNCGKTTFMANVFACAQQGRTILDDRPVNASFMLWINADQSCQDMQKTIDHSGMVVNDGIWILEPGDRLDTVAGREALEHDIRAAGADLVFIDTLSEVVDDDFDATREAHMRPFCKGLKRLARITNCAIVVAHHTTKGSQTTSKSAQGHNVLTATVDRAVLLDAKGRDGFILKVDKLRGAAKPPAIHVVRVPQPDGTLRHEIASGKKKSQRSDEPAQADAPSLADRIVVFVRDNPGANKAAICAHVRGRKQTCLAEVDRLALEGALRDAEGGGYEVGPNA